MQKKLKIVSFSRYSTPVSSLVVHVYILVPIYDEVTDFYVLVVEKRQHVGITRHTLCE